MKVHFIWDDGQGGEFECTAYVGGGEVIRVEPLGWEPSDHAWACIEERARDLAALEVWDEGERL